MTQFSRFNALDQILDIQGSFSQSSTRLLTDETAGFGAPLASQTGAAASITTFGSGVSTVTGLTGMTPNSVGGFLTVSGAVLSGNNGTFLIISFISSSSVRISNAAGVAPDANNGSISWTERRAYSLNDDLDFERTDRAAIKGAAYDAAIPTYQRPTAIGTDVAANLANIAGKTTDARGFIFNRKFSAATVAASDTLITITSASNLEHADSVNKTGIPCFDVVPYTGDYPACYVEILNTADGTQFVVLAGLNAGDKIYGLSQEGASTSPNSVEVALFSVPFGGDVATDSTPYTWEAGLPTLVDLFYGFFQRLDQVNEYAFRTIQSLGVEESGGLRRDIDDIQTVIGMADGDTFLTGLTNSGNYFPFVDLPNGTPTVTAALNTLNEQIGDRNYTGPQLTDGQTITASLQALADLVAGVNIVRYIERLVSDVPANTSHLLPGGAAYVLDGTDSGMGLSVYTRGLLRDPGSVAGGNDYAETDTTHVTFYSQLKAGDHINYYVYG